MDIFQNSVHPVSVRDAVSGVRQAYSQEDGSCTCTEIDLVYILSTLNEYCFKGRGSCETVMVMATNSIANYFCPLNQGRPKHFYKEPRILRCLHSFCKDCLEELSSDSTICCPTCSQTTSLGKNKVNGLPQDVRLAQETAGAVVLSKLRDSPTCEKCSSRDPAVRVHAAVYCLDCGEFLCNDCELEHQKLKNHTGRDLSDLPKHDISTLSPPVQVFCPKHHHEVGSHYCLSRDCLQFACPGCDDHLYHRIFPGQGEVFLTLDAAAQKQKNSLTKSMSPIPDAVRKLEEHIQCGRSAQSNLKETADKAKASINVTFDNIIETLKKQRQTLIAQVDTVVTSKCTLLCIQNEKLEETRDELSSALQTTQLLVDSYRDSEVLAVANLHDTALHEKLKDYKSLLPLPPVDDFLEVTVNPMEQLSLGHVNGGCCPATSTIVGYQTNRLVCERQRTLIVEARDEFGRPYGRGGEEVFCRYFADGRWEQSNVVDDGNGRYKIFVTAPQVSKRWRRVEVRVSIRKQPIKGSPFQMHARNAIHYPDVKNVDYQLSLSSPACVAPGHSTVYVTAYQDQDIYKMDLGWSSDRYDKVYRYIPVPGAQQLHAIATLGGSTIFVTDCGTNEVIKLKEDGEVQARFGGIGSEEGQFDEPRGLAVDEEGRIYVGERGNKRIQVFNSDFSHCLTIRLPDQVHGIALDTSCNIHATQFRDGCIKVYSPSGKYIREYGRGHLCQPQNLFVDEEDFSLVTDRGYKPVKIFDQRGTLIHSFGSEVKFADGICISPFGEEGTFIYVCDRKENVFYRYYKETMYNNELQL